MPFILLISLIIIHELGHFFGAIIFKIEVNKICIYPFGGISKFNIQLNEVLWKELLILLMGPIFQIIFYILLTKMNYFYNYQNLITIYNYTILFFNLLPIYPLDGGKLLNILLSYRFSFKKSLEITILISYIIVVILFIYLLMNNISISIIIVTTFLIYNIRRESKQKNYIMYKFLLERYINSYKFKKRKKVTSIEKFMRNKNHIIKVGEKYYTEKEILNKKFSK